MPARLFTMVDDVAPERCVRLAIERSDEPADDRAEHLRPGGGLLAEVVETPEAAVNLLPVRLFAFEGDRWDPAFDRDVVLKIPVCASSVVEEKIVGKRRTPSVLPS